MKNKIKSETLLGLMAMSHTGSRLSDRYRHDHVTINRLHPRGYIFISQFIIFVILLETKRQKENNESGSQREPRASEETRRNKQTMTPPPKKRKKNKKLINK